ncbi:MAG: PIN domain-containing protein [Planctomycetales bacterium]|nr:PIN domain-containing protein [Planctomycetales bacterium]
MILLDTNALSEPLKKRPHPEYLRRLAAEPAESLATSVVCVYEMRHGALRGAAGSVRWQRIEREVLPRVVILPLGLDEALRAGEISADLEGRGVPIGLEDVLIGATALVQGCAVVTRNLKHFSKIPGLRVFDWWA